MVESKRFIISHAETDEDFASIETDIFAEKCVICHSDFPRIPNLAQNFYNYTVTDGLAGAYDLRSEIYRRAVVMQNMPPYSVTLIEGPGSALTPTERARLGEWLLAGAPEDPE